MLRLEMLPAFFGDCLWIEYGNQVKPYRILIDTGTPGTYPVLRERIEALPEKQRHFELFVVSHIDEDHIGSAVKLLENPPAGVEFGDVWFNGYRHLLMASDQLGVKKAQELTVILDEDKVPWNQAFQGKPVMVPKAGELPVKELEGGMKLTLLSPYREELVALLPKWEEELRKLSGKNPQLIDQVAADHLGAKLNVEALAQTAFKEDSSETNGSSIAVLAEYGGHRLLLGADAFPSAVEKSVDRLLGASGESRLNVDVVKVCHHCSRENTSPSLPQKLESASWLISTNGERYHHPHREAVARLIHFGAPGSTLHFNYRTDLNAIWDDAVLKKKHGYKTEYPDDGREGYGLELQ